MLNILVPTDYSPDAKNALLYALNFAKQTQSNIIVHHTMPLAIVSTDVPFENFYFNEDEELQTLKESVNNYLESIKFGSHNIKISYYVNSDDNISSAINSAYKATNADVVIMGTHGASGFKKYLIGSNTSRLIAKYDIPVIAIPNEYKFEPIYHIVYASDLKNFVEELSLMIPIAKIFQAVLDVFYFDYATDESEKLMLNAEKVISEHPYKNIKLTVKKGKLELPLSEQILNNISYNNTQMIALFRGTQNWLDKLLTGSTSQQIVMDSRMPVFITKKVEQD
ncbi:MAG: universal stress protein [Bacteroidia bacterium]